MEKKYQHKKIEYKVQNYWETNNTFQAIKNIKKEKFYCLSMIPYPSGKLHMGHIRNYTIGDVIARYQRMQGKNVLHPIGWDAFGLPAENAAIQHKKTPSDWTYLNINYMKKQLKLFGFSYDWSREIITCLPEYYHWEQWFFIHLYKKGLIYKKKSIVNWCPNDKTVLANEQVINNHCWRCNYKTQKKKIPQWFIKITNYAEQLLNDIDKLKYWPKKIKIMQRNWIGRSEGLEVTCNILDSEKTITVYTTNLDTFMGITYILVSIEHPITKQISSTNPAVHRFIKKYKNINTTNFQTNFIQRTGITTDLKALHPLTKEPLPIWISNYISTDYGTHSVMAVPAHNQQDLEFANKHKLTIKPVILDDNDKQPKINHQAMIKKGKLFNSGAFNGLNSTSAAEAITKELITLGLAKRTVHYRLKDWNISRQRYWGTPIPILYLKDNKIIPISEHQLPVILPEKIVINKDISKILKLNDNWVNVTYNGCKAVRETDTFDTFIESSWYYARYTCPNYKDGMLCPQDANYWLPVDQYIGGIEHATMHLMYFRFFHKLMRDMGLLNSDEPVKKLLCQGMVLADTFYYFDKNNNQIWVSSMNINIKKDKTNRIISATDKNSNKLVYAGMQKMSKSKNNGVDPSIMIEKYGADVVRFFIMFAAPADMPLEWKESGIQGSNRFLNKLWKFVYQHIQHGKIIKLDMTYFNDKQKQLYRDLHKTIQTVTNDIDKRQKFNTAIASIMKLFNKIISFSQTTTRDRSLIHEALLIIIRLLYPFTPHICFVLWEYLGAKNIDFTKWPIKDDTALIEDTKLILIQINGKLKNKIFVPINANEDFIHKIALQNKLINKYLKKNKTYKTIYIANKLLNFVFS